MRPVGRVADKRRYPPPPPVPPALIRCGVCGVEGRAVVAIRPSGVKRVVVVGCRCERRAD